VTADPIKRQDFATEIHSEQIPVSIQPTPGRRSVQLSVASKGKGGVRILSVGAIEGGEQSKDPAGGDTKDRAAAVGAAGFSSTVKGTIAPAQQTAQGRSSVRVAEHEQVI